MPHTRELIKKKKFTLQFWRLGGSRSRHQHSVKWRLSCYVLTWQEEQTQSFLSSPLITALIHSWKQSPHILNLYFLLDPTSQHFHWSEVSNIWIWGDVFRPKQQLSNLWCDLSFLLFTYFLIFNYAETSLAGQSAEKS